MRRLGARGFAITSAVLAAALTAAAFAPPRMALTAPLWDCAIVLGWAAASSALALSILQVRGNRRRLQCALQMSVHRVAGYVCACLIVAHAALLVAADPLVLSDLGVSGPAYETAGLLGLLVAWLLPLSVSRFRRRAPVCRLVTLRGLHVGLGLALVAMIGAHVAGSGSGLLGAVKPLGWAVLCATAGALGMRAGRQP